MEGIARYIYETTRRMVADHPEDEFHFFFDRPYDEQFIFGDNVTGHVLSPQSRHPILWYLWFEWAVPARLKKIKADVFLSGDMYLSLKTKVPTVMVSHDLNYEHYPQFLKWSHRHYMLHYSPTFHKAADKLIAVSESTKRDIVSTYQIEPADISVAHNATPEGFMPLDEKEQEQIRKRFTNGHPYFIYIGSLHPRKNVSKLLSAFDKFKATDSRKMKLIIYGRAAFKTSDIYSTYEKMNAKSDVVFLDDSSISSTNILAAAYCMCYVSLYEGFGIPILEAFSAHIPVITSDVSSMPEVAGNAALLVDPTSGSAIAAAMHKITNDAELKDQLIARGLEQKKKFYWQKSAEIIYKNLKASSQHK